MKAAVHPCPARPEPPLKLNAPTPTFVQQNSTFGFKSNLKAPSESEIAPESDVDMEEDSDSIKNAEENLAEEISRFNHNNNSESRNLFYLTSTKYLLLDDDDDIYVSDNNSSTIDEDSPDEDERRAIQILQTPRRVKRILAVTSESSGELTLISNYSIYYNNDSSYRQ